MDDETGWTQILVDGWGPLVRAAVVDRVERAMVGRRGVLVRALVEEGASAGHAACVEQVHEQIVEAIRVETGADLDRLGSQAAWATYDEVWGQLQARWAGRRGRGIVEVPTEVVDEVVLQVRTLTPLAAQHAGADIGAVPWQLLLVGDRPGVDVDGLFAYLARDVGGITDVERETIDRIILLARPGDPDVDER